MIKNFKLFETRSYAVLIKTEDCKFIIECELTKESLNIIKYKDEFPDTFTFKYPKGTIKDLILWDMFKIDYDLKALEKFVRNVGFYFTRENYYYDFYLELKLGNEEASRFGLVSIVDDGESAEEYFKENDIQKIEDLFELKEDLKLKITVNIEGKYNAGLPKIRNFDDLEEIELNEGEWWSPDIVVEGFDFAGADNIDIIPKLLLNLTFYKFYNEIYYRYDDLLELSAKRKKEFAITLGNTIVDHADSEEEAEEMIKSEDYNETGMKNGKRVELYNKDAIIINTDKMSVKELSTYSYFFDDFDVENYEEYLIRKYIHRDYIDSHIDEIW